MLYLTVICLLAAVNLANPITGELFTKGVCHSPSTNENSLCTPSSNNAAYPLPVHATVNCSCTTDGEHRGGSIVYPTGELYTIRGCSADGTWNGTSPICVLNLTRIVQFPVLVRGHESTKEFQIGTLRSAGEFDRINIDSSAIYFDVKLRHPATIQMLQLDLNWGFALDKLYLNNREIYNYEINWNENKSIPQFNVRIPNAMHEYVEYSLELHFREIQYTWSVYDVHVFDCEGNNLGEEGAIQSVKFKSWTSVRKQTYEYLPISVKGGQLLSHGSYIFVVVINLKNKTKLQSIQLDLDKKFDLKIGSTTKKSSFYSIQTIKEEEIDVLLTLSYQDPIEVQSNINLTLDSGSVRSIRRLDVFGNYDNTEDCWFPEKNEVSLLEVIRTNTTGRFQTASYSCPEGYLVEGNSKRACLPDGQWSLKPLSCLKFTSYIETYITIGAVFLLILLLSIMIATLVIWKRRRLLNTVKNEESLPSVKNLIQQTDDNQLCENIIPNRPGGGATGLCEHSERPMSYQFEENELYDSVDV